jgi:hypothetical protein
MCKFYKKCCLICADCFLHIIHVFLWQFAYHMIHFSMLMLPVFFCSVFLFIVEEYMVVTTMLSFGRHSRISGVFLSHEFQFILVQFTLIVFRSAPLF